MKIFMRLAVYRLAFVTAVAGLGFILSILVQDAWAQTNFRIGAVLPLTGTAADYGVAIKNGIELARRDRPDLFSNLGFVFEDAAFDPKVAVAGFKRLFEQERVSLALTWGVAFCKALAPIAEANKIPLVGICLDPSVAVNRRYVLRFKNTIDEVMGVQAKFLHNQGLKRIGLILAEHPYLEEAKEALIRGLNVGQTVEILDELPSQEMDLRSFILKISRRKNEFDVLGVFLYPGQIASFYKQSKELGFKMLSFGTDFFESLSEIKASNGLMEGVPFASIEIRDSFIQRYKSLFHNESQIAFGAPAYEFALTIGELFNSLKHQRLSADEIVRKFSEVSPTEGVAAGPYRYVNSPSAGQYFQFPIVIKKIVGEGFVVVR